MRYSLSLLPVLVLTTLTSTLEAATIHVPGDEPTVQAGIDACVDGDTVLVADGIYTGEGNRDIDYGGRAIVVMSENGPEVTIIDCEGDAQDHHRGFIFHGGEDTTSVLKGFTIRNSFVDSIGAGILCRASSPKVIDCILEGNIVTGYTEDNIGGGMANIEGSQPIVIHCTFSGNVADGHGAGMGNDGGSHPTVIHCVFIDNYALYNGGGIWNDGSSPMVANCTFIQNGGLFHGGGMSNWMSSPRVINCTFSENSTISDNSGGMCNSQNSNPIVVNCILWNDDPGEFDNNSGSNPRVIYNDVQGGYPGVGNIDTDPLFVSFHGFDYLLGRGSPCIDAGFPVLEDGFEWPDWYMNGPRSDMGAYGGPGNVGWLK